MTKHPLLIVLLAVSVLFLTGAGTQAQPVPQRGDLTVIVTGLKNNSGVVRIGLNNTKKNYLSRGSLPSFRAGVCAIENNTARHVFRDIPAGEYTIKLYHDENNNDTVDANMLGIPREAYAFSNNVRGVLGLPRYEKAKFAFNAPAMTMEIAIR